MWGRPGETYNVTFVISKGVLPHTLNTSLSIPRNCSKEGQVVTWSFGGDLQSCCYDVPMHNKSFLPPFYPQVIKLILPGWCSHSCFHSTFFLPPPQIFSSNFCPATHAQLLWQQTSRGGAWEQGYKFKPQPIKISPTRTPRVCVPGGKKKKKKKACFSAPELQNYPKRQPALGENNTGFAQGWPGRII